MTEYSDKIVALRYIIICKSIVQISGSNTIECTVQRPGQFSWGCLFGHMEPDRRPLASHYHGLVRSTISIGLSTPFLPFGLRLLRLPITLGVVRLGSSGAIPCSIQLSISFSLSRSRLNVSKSQNEGEGEGDACLFRKVASS